MGCAAAWCAAPSCWAGGPHNCTNSKSLPTPWPKARGCLRAVQRATTRARRMRERMRWACSCRSKLSSSGSVLIPRMMTATRPPRSHLMSSFFLGESQSAHLVARSFWERRSPRVQRPLRLVYRYIRTTRLDTRNRAKTAQIDILADICTKRLDTCNRAEMALEEEAQVKGSEARLREAVRLMRLLAVGSQEREGGRADCAAHIRGARLMG